MDAGPFIADLDHRGTSLNAASITVNMWPGAHEIVLLNADIPGIVQLSSEGCIVGIFWVLAPQLLEVLPIWLGT